MLKKSHILSAIILISSPGAWATTAYGELGNFDTVNNTGHPCYGFEIELDGVHSNEVTYTYDWNHYGAPIIREDTDSSGQPRTFVRYTAKTKDATGKWLEFTNAETAANPIGPTSGHQCTDPSVNFGCEHFGIGNYGTPTALKYNWLVDDGTGGGPITTGEPVSVAAPVWQPVYVDPNLPPDPVNNPIVQVIAVIPAPVVPIQDPPAIINKKYGEPSWVNVIKTKTHNKKILPLADLVGADHDNDGKADWANGEPNEVESEFKLLQTNNEVDVNGLKKKELEGNPDDLPNGDETVTRRYEFYKYAAGPGSIDGENGEAMCDEVAADGIHGIGTTTVTDANGGDHDFDCSAVAIVGAYVGAQMAGFNAEAPLGMIDHLQDGKVGDVFPDRTVIVGGNTPYIPTITGALPNGLSINPETGVLSGTPTVAGNFPFTVEATDTADDTKGYAAGTVSKAYSIKIAAIPVQGDLDGDGSVTLSDYTKFRSSLGKCAGAAGFISAADYDQDGCVSNRDYKTWLTYYRKR